MNHKITIEIESEKEWSAACGLSSLLNKPVSELAKNDFIDNLTNIAKQIKSDKSLSDLLEDRNPENKKLVLAILN